MSVEEAKQKVAELVAKYQNLSSSEVKNFNEANTKQGFIEPLFRALGWDVDDTNEVTLEEKASNGRVDYAFKLHGVSQFYLEAKPLKADLTNESYIKQAVTYAYSKGVTWVVLTDFEELRLFNAQQNKPFLTLNCRDYAATFDKLWLLSHESLADGLLNKEASQVSALPLSLPIETRLFRQLRQWREDLFNQLYLYDKKLGFGQIDEIIQRLFNRLIFIRTCEDRGIEDKRLLAAVHQWKTGGQKGELVDSLKQIFGEFDGYYDSDLFAHHLTDGVFIMGMTLEQIITGLYEVPGGMASYDFSIIDADVLGAVYEQYLGHVAQVVKQRAKAAQSRMDLGIQTDNISLTSKKERRKEHGIYYTPKFVTDYIVKETVGRFIKERSVNEIRNIKILDPACGSGSFLIRAFNELLKHYASQKTSKSENDIDAADRISILTNNIFGVDLDIQAVEIARLNLLLRSLARRDRLPFLHNNIRPGNSLISGTEEELKKYFGDSWEQKKRFNWGDEFKDIMANGGFDVVIGNPPYVSIYKISTQPDEKQFFTDHFYTAYMKFDLYVLFIERALSLLENGGLFAFIVPGNFMVAPYGKNLRRLLVDTTKILQIVNLMGVKVFKEAQNTPVILLLQKETNKLKRDENKIEIIVPEQDPSELNIIIGKSHLIQQGIFLKSPEYTFLLETGKQDVNILTKIKERSIALDDICYISRGLTLGSTYWQEYTNYESEEQFIKKFIKGRNIKPYSIEYTGDHIVYNKEILTSAFFPELFENEKIIIPKISKTVCGGLDLVGYYIDSTGICCLPYTSISAQRKTEAEKIKRSRQYSLSYILGCVNSKVINYYFRKTFPNANVVPNIIRTFPIPRIDFANPTEKKRHDDLVALVDRMLELNKRLAPIRDTYGYEREELNREIKRTDAEIDQKVYKLYGLTEEERKIVEGENRK